jgi:alpha-ribazole phosphatase
MAMTEEAHLWLIRHAPVAGVSGVIHNVDAPADISNVDRIAALRAQLPGTKSVFCSPARRTLETALALGLNPVQPAFREQSFGAWTGRQHDDIAAELGSAYDDFWRTPVTS